MKVVCQNCGRYALGDEDALKKKGWYLSSGTIAGSKYSVILCPNCRDSNKIVEQVK